MKTVVDGDTTIYIGNYYEVKDPAGTPGVKKYYYAGGTRVAMKDNGLVRYFVTDHLGSTTKMINADVAFTGGGNSGVSINLDDESVGFEYYNNGEMVYSLQTGKLRR